MYKKTKISPSRGKKCSLYAGRSDPVGSKNSARLLPRTGPRWSFWGQQREVCETLLVDHEKRSQRRPLKIDHHGLVGPMFLGRSRGSVVVVQHAAQSLASLDRSVRVCRNSLGSNEPVAQPLMISLQMVMGHELSDRFPQ